MVTAAFRAVLGREPSPQELDELLDVAGRADFGSLIERLRASDEAAQRVLDGAPAALDRQLAHLASDGSVAAGDSRLVFLHIMKVAGTSVSRMLERLAGPSKSRVHLHLDELVLMPRSQLARLAVVAGHIPYEAVPLMPPAFQTLVVIRDPASRTISHYRELRQSGPRYADLSFDEFLHSEVFDVPSGNYQARQLAHTIGVADAWITYAPRERNTSVGGSPDDPHPLQSLFDSTPLLHGEEDLLRIATSNLTRIDHVGVTEDLETVARRVAPLFGGGRTAIPRLHVSDRHAPGDITAAQHRRIESRTQVDQELHRLAQRLASG